VFENRVLRRTFGTKRDEMAAAEEHCIMKNFATCKLRAIKSRMIWTRYVARMIEIKNVKKVLI
jgi:hypothetical protein